ncbi:uncharacterized protein BDZ99DRAFT_374890 [Mytilinidion resinicola]|uniref:T6SS Phospholipase effector Tle1-like catalytic domain-containing protein n=1 Tax=Mytilinidion resinicola TaxID=574789 RepID=A0A6A6Z9E5_9PEZI|nr:uncharacterized protein BDZ99DRAFT_374890 [Mytilinidion resinicola]KAF2817752.1 hypothetical protein BDZ99DRAFT_374890 [Mytilinidion resinicola]
MAADPAEGAGPPRPPAANKRLIVCCDGTWNDSISTDSPVTNVSRISRCIPGLSDTGVVQLVSYHTGVGSGTSKPGNIIDGMTGRGVSANIRDAYSFLCHNYLEDERNKDEIVLIGFSRGAFTVRSIASFMTDVGLLEKAGLNYMLKLYGLWSNQLSRKREKDAMFPGIPPSTPKIRMRRLCRLLEDRNLLRRGVKIKVCAVWDTVGSLGVPLPGPIPQRASKKLAFVNSALLENIDVAVQALALNEHRKHFQPTVWSTNSRTKLRQCWFLGAHSDVGGGYEDTGLANLTLVWMIAQLTEFVYFDHRALLHLASHKQIGSTEKFVTKEREFGIGNIKNSVTGPFLLGGTKSRKPGQYLMNTHGLYRNPKTVPISTNETIHWTVRVLLGLGLRECPALRKYSTKLQNGTGIVWTLHSKGNVPRAVELREDEFCALEKDLLESWMKAEGYEQHAGANSGVSLGLFSEAKKYMSLSEILIPWLGETQKPTVHFPARVLLEPDEAITVGS